MVIRTLFAAGVLAVSTLASGCGDKAATTASTSTTSSSTPASQATGVSLDGDAPTQISTYAAANGLNDVKFTPEGVGYVIETPGEGAHPTVSDNVTIHYRGYLVDGNEFDSSKGDPVTFPLSALIQAWQVAIPMIGRGGKIKIFAPPATAYGSNPPPGTSITANTVLVFDVELVNF